MHSLFLRLCSAEVALCLQPLDSRSRLAAAVTCKGILADAVQPLTWKRAEVVTVTPQQLTAHPNPPIHSILR
jgi:hypothetical protein